MRVLGFSKIFIFITLLSTFGFTYAIKHYTYSKTGHDGFSELVFSDDSVVLLKDMNQAFVEAYYKKLKWKFIGWSTYYLYEYVDCDYVSSVVFSRSNKTSMPYTFEYSLSEVIYEESSVTVKGSISVKESGKIKKLELSGSQQFDISGSTESSIKTTETGSLKITVYPGKKMTMRITGRAKLSTCFARYYFLGIPFGKGVFESIDVIDSFYELIEENV